MPVSHALKVSIFLSELLKSNFFTTYYKQQNVPWLISLLFHKQSYNQAATKGPRKELSDRSSYGPAVSLPRNNFLFPQKLPLLGHRGVVPPAKRRYLLISKYNVAMPQCVNLYAKPMNRSKFQPTPPKNWKRKLHAVEPSERDQPKCADLQLVVANER